MTIKITGTEWKRYLADSQGWEDSWAQEGEAMSINGISVEPGDIASDTIPDDAVVIIKGGVIYDTISGKTIDTVEGHFKRWKRIQTITTLLVEVKTDKAEDLKRTITAFGGKVLT